MVLNVLPPSSQAAPAPTWIVFQFRYGDDGYEAALMGWCIRGGSQASVWF
jgi:hypothetical protein